MIRRVLFANTFSYRNGSPAERYKNETDAIYWNPAYELMNGHNGKASKPAMRKSNPDSTEGSRVIKKRSVLHVDDNPEIRFLIKMLFKNEFEITGANTGEESLELLKEKSFDLILMDINLGSGISGIETSEAIRNMENSQNVPIIALTANNYHEIRENCIKAGINAYIQKPFDKGDILQTIADIDPNLINA